MVRATTLGAFAVLLAAVTASAKDTKPSALDEAKALAAKGEAVKAAERFGDAVAAAQSAGDLAAECAAADELERFFDDVFGKKSASKEAAGKTSDGPSRGLLLAAIMKKLDPNRCGAFVSAPVLARNVLELATETGDFGAVGEALGVAAAHATKPTSGRVAAVVAKYGEGLKAVADGKFEAATTPLADVLSEATKNGWFVLASHAATELSVAWVRLGAPDKAVATVTATTGAFDDACGIDQVASWLDVLSKRSPEQAAALRKPVEALMGKQERHEGGDTSTPGSPGANAGETPVSDVAKLLPRHAKGKAIASVTRTAKVLTIRWATKPAAKPTVDPRSELVVVKQEGGVTLGFWRPSVALRFVDLVNNTGGSVGGRREPSPVRAFYLLAEGETWSVAKDGVVTITR